MFVLRSTCFQAPCHVYAKIYMPMCSLPCLCLDLYAYVFFALFLLRSTCQCLYLWPYAQIYVFMCSMPCLCAQIYVGCYAMCYFRPLFLNISLSCFLALSVRCRSRSRGLGLHPYTQAYIKGFGSFPSNVYVCLHTSMLYLHVNLSRSKLCHSLCPLIGQKQIDPL